MKINGERLWNSLMQMASIGATEHGGNSRLALTQEDCLARDLFIQWCEAEGMIIKKDTIGNLFAIKLGTDSQLPPIVMGSHLDTQPKGGKFDGIYGVLSALEVIRTLNDYNLMMQQNIEIAVWMNEEGARFSPAMLGSAVFIGKIPLETAYQQIDHNGISVINALTESNQIGNLPLQRTFDAYFELHIEQGPILENHQSNIGVVTGGQAIIWLDITIQGFPLHAGTTPMYCRQDPLIGVAEMLFKSESIINRYSQSLLTAGEIYIKTPSRNTIPDEVRLTLDIRHPNQDTLDKLIIEIENTIRSVTISRKLTATITEVWRSPSIFFDAECIKLVRIAANQLDYVAEDLISGAGHDAFHLSKHCPSTMIFIPCEKGISHNETENISPKDAEQGANVLFQVIKNRAQKLK